MCSPILGSKKLIAQYKTEYVKEDWEMGLVDNKLNINSSSIKLMWS